MRSCSGSLWMILRPLSELRSHIFDLKVAHEERRRAFWWPVLWESVSPCPRFCLWKGSMVRKGSRQLESRRMETHVMHPLSLHGRRVNELPYKFHSSKALMSCCSLSIILDWESTLANPAVKNDGSSTRLAFIASHRQQKENVIFSSIFELAYVQCEHALNKRKKKQNKVTL